ncbi:MAG: endonuclease/exonuclease/phosphatase family protein [Promethearchaeota archaeon]
MTYKVFSSIWDLLFQILFSGGYLTIKHGWYIILTAFIISSLSLLLQIKTIEKKKVFYTILLNLGILVISMFIPSLLGVYSGILISNGFYSIKAQRNLPKVNKIFIGILNFIGFAGIAGICGIYIYYSRYIYSIMVISGLGLGIFLYLITPIRAFFFSASENLSPPRMKKIGIAIGTCFVVLTSSFCCLGFIRPYEPAPDTYTATGGMEVSVVTYNIRQGTGREVNEYDYWKYRKDDIAIVMDNFDADFICVQEAYNFQIRYLIKALTNRTYKFFGAGRDDGVIGGEHSGILFDSERFEVITAGNFWLSDYPKWPSHPWESRHNANRIISWARFLEIGTDEQIFVCSVHYDSGETWREKANVMLNERIAEYSGAIPTIVAGDFNLNTSQSYWDLLENYGEKPLNSSYHLAHGWQHYYNTTFSSFNPAASNHTSFMIDFIFVSNDITVNSCEILDDSYIGPDGLTHYASDHYPVIANCTM